MIRPAIIPGAEFGQPAHVRPSALAPAALPVADEPANSGADQRGLKTPLSVDAWALPPPMLEQRVVLLRSAHKPSKKPLLTRLSGVTPQPTRWLWRGHFARGHLHIIAGRGGVGKSTLVADLLARMSSGAAWPDGGKNGTQGDVVVISTEEDPATLHGKFGAAGADMARVHVLPPTFSFRDDLPALERALDGLADPVALLLDPVLVAIEGGDSNEAAAVRRQLGRVLDMCQRRSIALIGISHLAKSSENRDPAERVLASGAFTALARQVFIVTKDRTQSQSRHDRLAVLVKSNIARMDGGWRFGVDERDLGNHIETVAAHWGERVTGDPVDLLRAAEGEGGTSSPDAERPDPAAEFLRENLADGPQAVVSIIAAGKARGIPERQTRKAFAALGGTSTKSTFDGPRMWHLPVPLQNSQSSQSSQSSRPTLQSSEGAEPSAPIGTHYASHERVECCERDELCELFTGEAAP